MNLSIALFTLFAVTCALRDERAAQFEGLSNAFNAFGNLGGGILASKPNEIAGGVGAQKITNPFFGNGQSNHNTASKNQGGAFADFGNVFGNLANGAVASGQSALAGGAAALGSAANGFQHFANNPFFGLGRNQNNAQSPAAVPRPSSIGYGRQNPFLQSLNLTQFVNN